MKFAELTQGQVIDVGPSAPLSQEEVIEFATRYDPQWFHVDPAMSATRGKFGGLIASGWQTCGLAMRLVADAIMTGSEAFASPGLQYVKWPQPFRPGDTLRVRVDVLEARVSDSRPTLGIVRWKWTGRNQHGVTVLELEATTMYDLA